MREDHFCPLCSRLLPRDDFVRVSVLDKMVLVGDVATEGFTLSEIKILDLLTSRMPEAVRKQSIMDYLYEDSLDPPFDNLVSIFVCRLLHKLEGTRLSLVTVWGIGYRLQLLPEGEVAQAGGTFGRKAA